MEGNETKSVELQMHFINIPQSTFGKLIALNFERVHNGRPILFASMLGKGRGNTPGQTLFVPVLKLSRWRHGVVKSLDEW